MKITETTWKDILHLRDEVRASFRECPTLQGAAQHTVESFYRSFEESVVLARFFTTIPYGKLPPADQTFVTNLANSRGVIGLLDNYTPVLCLLGTVGVEPHWCNRHLSSGHIGIPLISSSFVEGIPMVAQLLQELQIDLGFMERGHNQVTQLQQEGTTAGLFYVQDAASIIDEKGRHVIPDQEFVAQYDIKTVFGLGGVYMSGRVFSLIVFTRDTIAREVVEQYAPLVVTIKANTADLEQEGRLFT
jgi:hypothetical protein